MIARIRVSVREKMIMLVSEREINKEMITTR